MAQRGIVISPTITANRYAGLDAASLRQCALFWDIIDCPEDALGGGTNLGRDRDLELLQQEGMLTRTKGYFFFKDSDGRNTLSFHAERPREFWRVAQLYAFKRNNQGDALWSIKVPNENWLRPDPNSPELFYFAGVDPLAPGQSTNVIAYSEGPEFDPDTDLIEDRAVDVELYQALLAPHADVPMEEILEFRDKRQDELQRFRHVMDKLYLDITISGDVARAKAFAIDTVQGALRDINKVMMESTWKRVLLDSVKVKLRITQGLVAAAADLALRGRFDLETVAATLGVVGSALTIETVLTAFQPKQIPPEMQDYAYLYHAQEEVGGR